MSWLGWLVVLLMIGLAGLAVMVGFWYLNQRHPVSLTELDILLQNRVEWSEVVKSSNPNKGQCQLYTFPTVSITYNSKHVYSPPTPTTNSVILDKMVGTTDIPDCIDSDQIVAQQVTRTCTGPDVNTDGKRISLCRREDGTYASFEQTENLYVSKRIGGLGTCPNIDRCPGRLSLISPAFNYAFSIDDKVCLVKSGTTTKVAKCVPETGQIFRITRKNPEVEFLTVAQPQDSGLLAQIYDRTSNTYMNAGKSTGTTIFSPNSAPTRTFTGKTVDWTSDSGFNWLMLPSTKWCTLKSGCSANTSCGLSCHTEGNSSTCLPNLVGETCPVSSVPLTVPPQMVYIAGLDTSTAPIINPKIKIYRDLTGIPALLLWLSDSGASSLYYGGSFPASGDKPILVPISQGLLNYSQIGMNALSTQYINLDQYNTLIKTQVCVQDITSQCVSL